MKILYIEPKRRRNTTVTDFNKVLEAFLSSGEDFVIWGNPVHKNPYVTQIATINYCKRCGRIGVKVRYRNNTTYIVREDAVDSFVKIVGR